MLPSEINRQEGLPQGDFKNGGEGGSLYSNKGIENLISELEMFAASWAIASFFTFTTLWLLTGTEQTSGTLPLNLFRNDI